jgi:phosphoglucosamine mutase
MKKLFGTDGIRGEFSKYPMDLETVFKLGKAVGEYFGGKCLIGRDTRESGPIIEKALVDGLISRGIDVYLSGIITTPGVSYLTKTLEMDFGIVISASHNPYSDNGIKFFDKDGFKLSRDTESKIEELFFENAFKETTKKGKIHWIDNEKDEYLNFLKNSGGNLNGLKIVLDCANGAAYRIAPIVFTEFLGAEVMVVNNCPDGKNINEKCGAVHPELLKEKILEYGADIGITLDGDADRVILLDETGKVVDGDYILAISGIYLKEKGLLKNDLVIGTIMANIGLEKSFERHGITLAKTKVGDQYVMDEMLKRGSIIGGEQSGHIIFSEYINTGDGILSALQVLKIMKEKEKKLSELRLVMEKYPQTLINIKVKEKKKIEEMGAVSLRIKEVEKRLGNEGRVLVRYSGTQNLLRVMVEGKEQEMIEKCAYGIVEEVRREIGA